MLFRSGKQVDEAYPDRGYKGIATYKNTKIFVPKPNKNITKTKREKHSTRATIEPKIGHLKQDHRLCRNYLKGIIGDNINVILAAAGMNFKRVINLLRKEAKNCWLLIYILFVGAYRNCIAQKTKNDFLRDD